MLVRVKHLPARQPLRQLWTTCAADSDCCNGASAAACDSSRHLFFLEWCVYDGSVRFNWKWLFIFSFSFFLELRVGHAKKIISALQFIFSFDSIPHLLFAIFCIYIDYLYLDFIFDFIFDHLIFEICFQI
jgi:hypothetical protein